MFQANNKDTRMIPFIAIDDQKILYCDWTANFCGLLLEIRCFISRKNILA